MIAARTAAARTVAALAAAALLATAAACSGTTRPGPTTVVTVTAAPPSATPTAAGTPGTTAGPVSGSAASSGASPAASAPPSSTVAMAQLPGRCDGLLPLGSVVDAAGRSIPGTTAFVVGTADADTGRVSYLNCRYGAGKDGTNPAVEIGVSLYRTPAQAEARIQPTVEDYTQHAATATGTTVGGLPATLLDGGVGTGYGPTIVLADGQRTVAVSLRAGSVSAATATRNLTALAALAAARTGTGG